MSAPSICVAIPARFESSRLPGKLLLDETGKYLVQHVYENASICDRVDSVYVATDSDRIASAVSSFGGAVIRTGTHPSGTDRLSEAVGQIEEDIVINIQGDEPEVACREIHALVDLMSSGRWSMGTLCTPITDPEVLRRSSCVKVVTSNQGKALYFSRAPIPWDRDRFSGSGFDPSSDTMDDVFDPSGTTVPWKLHIGMYGFTRETLQNWSSLQPGTLEQIEGLEQLRALEHGVDIGVAEVPEAPIGIDTQDEYDAFVRRNTS